MGQALGNVLNDAIHFTEADGRIVVRAGTEGDGAAAIEAGFCQHRRRRPIPGPGDIHIHMCQYSRFRWHFGKAGQQERNADRPVRDVFRLNRVRNKTDRSMKSREGSRRKPKAQRHLLLPEALVASDGCGLPDPGCNFPDSFSGTFRRRLT